MDGLMDAGGARGASLLRVEDECEIDLERLGDDTAGDGDGFGARTRNDNANALGGVFPYYAAPQECVPVFFEPKPTAAMIAAKVVPEQAGMADVDDRDDCVSLRVP